jgi:hypothetical protein
MTGLGEAPSLLSSAVRCSAEGLGLCGGCFEVWWACDYLGGYFEGQGLEAAPWVYVTYFGLGLQCRFLALLSLESRLDSILNQMDGYWKK